jgi:hypothetical protein
MKVELFGRVKKSYDSIELLLEAEAGIKKWEN